MSNIKLTETQQHVPVLKFLYIAFVKMGEMVKKSQDELEDSKTPIPNVQLEKWLEDEVWLDQNFLSSKNLKCEINIKSKQSLLVPKKGNSATMHLMHASTWHLSLVQKYKLENVPSCWRNK